MVTEFVIFQLKPGSSAGFEAAFASVAPLLTRADGHLRHRLSPTLDADETWLLQVEWRDLEAHTRVFEPSEAHTRFIAALDPFLQAEPVVVHVPTDARSQ